MADSKRNLIRDAVIAKLKSADIVGDRVYGNRSRKIFRNECPCILVYTGKENAEIVNESPREYKRSLELAVEVVMATSAEADDGIDDQFDALAVAVEKAVFTDETQGGNCDDTILGDTDLDIIDDGEKPIGAGKITFTMPYYEYIPQVDAEELDDLTKANVKIGPPEEQNEAKDNQLSEDTVNLDT